MIRVVGNDKKYNHSLEQYDEMINNATSIGYEAIYHFFDLIGIDRNLFSHFKDIKMVLDLDKENKDMVAFYENLSEDDIDLDNSIHFLPEYLDYLIDDYMDSYVDLVKTVIHETIHANRSITINNGVLYPECYLRNAKEYEKYSLMLGDLIKDSSYLYQVLKFDRSESFYTVYAYENITGDFYIFRLPINFDITSIKDMDELLNKKNRLFDLISRVENPYDKEDASIVANYSTSYKDPLTITKKDTYNISSETNKQMDFEECLTEAFAQIIYYLKDKDEYNIDELIEYGNFLPYIELALEYIKTLDMDTIRWFFLSCYDEEYRNRFYELYGKDYFKLIDNYSFAFDQSMQQNPVTNYDSTISLIKQLKK